MKQNSPRQASLEQDLNAFLQDICVNWGFCGKLDVKQLLKDGKGGISSKSFAAAILTAAGMKPDHSQWVRKIKRLFFQRYDTHAVFEDSFSA